MSSRKGTERGRFLAELRRSNAASRFDHEPTRTETDRAAIEDSLDRNSLEPEDDSE